MHYIVALGNPGATYARTRHNAGWRVAEYLVERLERSSVRELPSAKGRLYEGAVGDYEVSVLFPETFMNNSGQVVRAYVPKDAYGQLLVVHDDVDLPFGTIRLSRGSRANGHNGVASIITQLGTPEFVRLRIGVGRRNTELSRPQGGEDLERYVLSAFSTEEEEALPVIFKKALAVVTQFIAEGYLRAKEVHGV